MSNDDNVTHSGGCHCGAVRFEVEAPAVLVVFDCNCSRCRMLGYEHLIVPSARFQLLCGEQMLTTYGFNTGVAKHLFCRACGVQSFYVPRSNPDGFSVNARCIDEGTVRAKSVEPFDGRDWESHAAELAHLSEDD